MAPVNLNMRLLVRFLFALILIHPAIAFSENKYSGNFQIKYGAVDFHKTDTYQKKLNTKTNLGL